MIMQPLLHLNYELKKDLILKESEEAKKLSIFHTDGRYPNKVFTDWKVSIYSGNYIEQIMKDFEVTGTPRFYWLKPNAFINTHTDGTTKCSLNFLLSESNTAITINNQNYFYKSALLDTTQPHSVKNGDNERLLFKISIENESFEQVANRIIEKKYYDI
jgi:hypothetical protein